MQCICFERSQQWSTVSWNMLLLLETIEDPAVSRSVS